MRRRPIARPACKSPTSRMRGFDPRQEGNRIISARALPGGRSPSPVIHRQRANNRFSTKGFQRIATKLQKPLDRPETADYNASTFREGLTKSPASIAASCKPREESAQVAQLVEQGTENPRVGGSIPPLGTIAPKFSLSSNDLVRIFVPFSGLSEKGGTDEFVSSFSRALFASRF